MHKKRHHLPEQNVLFRSEPTTEAHYCPDLAPPPLNPHSPFLPSPSAPFQFPPLHFQSWIWTLIAPLVGSAAIWKASTARSSGNRWVTRGLRLISPPETRRSAFGYCRGHYDFPLGAIVETQGMTHLVSITILELQVDLVRREVAKGELRSISGSYIGDKVTSSEVSTCLLLGWPHTDDKHFATKDDRLKGT